MLELQSLIAAFSTKRILVIGDVMLDTYIWGNVERVSPESPVPVVDVKMKEHRLGGAANVALNVKELGAVPILISVCGDDDAGLQLRHLLSSRGISGAGLIESSGKVTTEKTRVLSRNQQMLRFDTEDPTDLSEDEEARLIDNIHRTLHEQADAVILQDYNKGALTPRVIENVMKLCADHHVPTAVDPKRWNFFAYKGATIFKPNLRELRENMPDDGIASIDEHQLLTKSNELRQRIGNAITLITLSERGIFYHHESEHFIEPAHKVRQVADVSGAGDTVIALAALCHVCGVDARTMCRLANVAAGLVCEKVGVVPITTEALVNEVASSG